MGALVGAVHDVLVGPLEIEGVDHRLAQLRILELLPACVHEPPLRARGRIVGNDLALDTAVADRGKIVARGPHPRGELLAEQEILGGEGLKTGLALPIELEPHHVEVVEAAPIRQLRAPPVLHPLIFDEMADFEAADLVGARAERRVERGFVERPVRVVGAREDRQVGNQKRHVSPALGRKARNHCHVIGRLGTQEVTQLLGDEGMAFVLEDIQ